MVVVLGSNRGPEGGDNLVTNWALKTAIMRVYHQRGADCGRGRNAGKYGVFALFYGVFGVVCLAGVEPTTFSSGG